MKRIKNKLWCIIGLLLLTSCESTSLQEPNEPNLTTKAQLSLEQKSILNYVFQKKELTYYDYVSQDSGITPSPNPQPGPTVGEADYNQLVQMYGTVYIERENNYHFYFKCNWGYADSKDNININADVLSFNIDGVSCSQNLFIDYSI